MLSKKSDFNLSLRFRRAFFAPILLVALIFTGCFPVADDFYSYIVLTGSIKLDEPSDLITVEVDSKGTLLSNEQQGESYEISIGATEHCHIDWTIGNVKVQTATVYKKWDSKNHLTGMEIAVKDERTGESWTIYSKTPDSREWVIDLNKHD